MKKLLLVVLALMVYQHADAAQKDMGMDTPMDARYEQIAQEAARNRELLEIWKEHVRNLTRERDDFANQLDALKGAQASAVHFGQVETQPIPQLAAVQPDIEALRSEIASDFQYKLEAASSEKLQLQRELQETQADKNVLISDKEQAMRQVETLSKEITSLKNEIAALKASSFSQARSIPDSEKLSFELNKLKQTSEALEKDLQSKNDQIQDLRSQLNDAKAETVRGQADTDKTRSIEKSFSESRAHLNAVIDGLREENQRLKTAALDNSRVWTEKNALEKDFTNLKVQIDRRESEFQSLQRSYSEVQTENGKLQTAARETSRLLSERNDLERNYEEFKAQVERQGSEFQDLQSSHDTLQKELQAKRSELSSQASRSTTEINRRELDLKEAGEKIGFLQDSKTELTAEIEGLNGKLQEAKAEKDALDQEIQTVASRLKAEIQMREAEKENARQSALAFKKKSEENESLKIMLQHQLEAAESYAALEKHAQEQASKLQTLTTVASQLKEENAGLEAQIARQSKAIQTLRSNLAADFSDIQNLKSNIESYLESLSLSFEKRQK